MASLTSTTFEPARFRHGPLSVGRNHFVLRRNEVPTGLGFPPGTLTISAECLHAHGPENSAMKAAKPGFTSAATRPRTWTGPEKGTRPAAVSIGGAGAPAEDSDQRFH